MMLAQRDRLTLLAGIVPTVAVVALGWLFFISPQNSKTSDLHAQAGDSADQTTLMTRHLSDLRTANKNLAAFKAQLAVDQLALPTVNDVPTLLRSLQEIGTASGAAVTAVTVSAPVAATVTAAAPATTTTTSTGTTPTVPHAAGMGAVYQMTMSVTASGTEATLEAFVKGLQQGQPRALLITSTSFASGSTGAGTTLQVSLLAFLAPASN
jgi:type II secretory pathway component PulM